MTGADEPNAGAFGAAPAQWSRGWSPSMTIESALALHGQGHDALLRHAGALARHGEPDGKAMSFVQMFAVAAANRALQLSLGIAHLVREYLFFAAVPLVRVHLDGMLRMGYVVVDPDGEDVAREVYTNGTEFKKIRTRGDPGGLTDKALLTLAEHVTPWVGPLYRATSAYVHTSERVATHPFGPPDEAGERLVTVQERENNWPNEFRVELLHHADAITRGVIEYARFQRTGILVTNGVYFQAPPYDDV